MRPFDEWAVAIALQRYVNVALTGRERRVMASGILVRFRASMSPPRLTN